MRRVSAILALALPVAMAAQAPDPRAPMPERPTVATHAFTVAPGYFELETGYESDRNPDQTHSWLLPVYLKVGLSKRAQLGVSSSVVAPGFIFFTPNGPIKDRDDAGVGDLTFALKYRLADSVPVIGALAVLPSVKLPTGNNRLTTTTTDVGLLLISSHKFADAALDVNVGYTRRSGDGTRAPKNATLWTVSGGIPVTNAVGFALEVFGYPGTRGETGSPPTVALLGGPTLAIGPRAVLDLGVIRHLHGPQPDALYAGLTLNLGHF